MQAHWEHFEHGADIGVRGFGQTKAEAFEQAAVALTAVVTDPEKVAEAETIEIDCEAPDDEQLLTEWLNSVIYKMAIKRMIFHRFDVHIAGHHLHAEMQGEPASVPRHQPAVEVKGATFTTLRVAPFDGGWVAQTVVDV